MPRADDGSVKSRIADSSTVLLQGIGKIEVTSSVRAAGNAARVFQSEGTCFIRYHQVEAISRIGVEESGTLTQHELSCPIQASTSSRITRTLLYLQHGLGENGMQ